MPGIPAQDTGEPGRVYSLGFPAQSQIANLGAIRRGGVGREASLVARWRPAPLRC